MQMMGIPSSQLVVAATVLCVVNIRQDHNLASAFAPSSTSTRRITTHPVGRTPTTNRRRHCELRRHRQRNNDCHHDPMPRSGGLAPHGSRLRMSPKAAPEEEKAEKNPVSEFFNVNSFVRSTTQTEAIGRRTRQQQSTPLAENGTEEGEETRIPPEVLRPFSLLLLSQFILFIGVGAVIPTIPLYGQSIGLSNSSNGIVISAPAVALLLASRSAGRYADLGRKGAMLGGMACIAVSDLGTALSSDLPSLILARLGLGLGRGYAEAGERGMLADLAGRAPTLRGRALASQQACTALGIALGAPLGGLVVQEYGARSAFLCVSVAALVALAMYAALPETVVAQERRQGWRETTEDVSGTSKNRDDAIGNDDEDGDGDEDDAANWTKLLQTSATWRSLAVAQSGTSFGFACKIAVVPILANAYLGGAAGAGLLLSAAGLAGLAGAPLGGFLADKAGSRTAAAVAGAASGASLACVPLGLSLSKGSETIVAAEGSPLVSSSPSADIWHSALDALGGPASAAFAILILLWSLGASAQGPALTALAQEKAPVGSEATALGLPRAVGDGTYIVAPLVLGYFSDAMGENVPGIACAVAGCAICLGSAALFSLSEEEESAS